MEFAPKFYRMKAAATLNNLGRAGVIESRSQELTSVMDIFGEVWTTLPKAEPLNQMIMGHGVFFTFLPR